MKAKHLLILGVLAVGIAVLLWRRGGPSVSKSASATSNTAASVTTTTRPTNPFPKAALVSSIERPESHTRAIQLAEEWIRAARPLHCDPVVRRVIERTNSAGVVSEIGISTPNYYIRITPRADGDVVHSAVSDYETDKTEPEHAAKWYQLTGKPNEQEIIAEAYAVFQRLGEAQPLSATNYEAVVFRLRTPDGNTVTNTPFVNVSFSDAGGKHIADLQYRMEASGPGLVRWWYWPKWRGQTKE